jgi:hypothetical protein
MERYQDRDNFDGIAFRLAISSVTTRLKIFSPAPALAR